MAKTFAGIDSALARWIESQPLFFVATAPSTPDGHVNVSPKGVDGTFAVLDSERVAYLDLTGSGVETIAHVRADGRITIMFCAFAGPPRIVRLQGQGNVLVPGDPGYERALAPFPAASVPGVRSVIEVLVNRVSDSCGFGVPLMSFAGHRPHLLDWAGRKGEAGLADYHRARNSASIDGLPGLPGLPLS